jgi:AraC family transcriptional regulator of adaptative response/methylated-DNA-[protein]-cysteine methyltransferase
VKVWEALLRVPEGRVTSYQGLAKAIGKPKAVRAVASAVAANPVGSLIPCHRVIRATGAIGDYHWGAERKLTLLAVEGARNLVQG